MALEHTARGVARRYGGEIGAPNLCNAHATDPDGKLRGAMPSAGVGVRPIAGFGQNEAWEARFSAAHTTEWRWNPPRVEPPDA